MPDSQRGGMDPGSSRGNEGCNDAEGRLRPLEEMAAVVVDAAYRVHRNPGPGLLETVYQAIFAHELERRGLAVARQVRVPVEFDGHYFDEGFRADLIVGGRLLLELKSVEQLAPVHAKQLLTYLRLMKLPLGFLINFGAARFQDGIRRVVNGHVDVRSGHLRIHQVTQPPTAPENSAL